MAVLGVNNCSPRRIYGPLPQTVFCGCSVISFSVSAGWNEQSSSLTVELAPDPCVGPRVWWDETLQRQTGDIADPGFTYPEPGCAAYFRIEENPDGDTEEERGGFEYCGIVEGWTEKKDANGNPVYTVRLTDPHVILENTQVIVNDFPGGVSGVWNLINAYAFVESLGSICTSSPAGAMGGVTDDNVIANIANERGMVWNDLKCALHTLCSAVDKSLANALYYDYCVDNRLVYVGPENGQDGYGIIEKDDTITNYRFQLLDNVNLNQQYYYLDLTEIPFGPLYYRISGPTISLAEIISQVCKDAGCDYYLELLPVRSAGKVIKVIKVRVAVRQDQPQLGRLQDFIDARKADASNANGGILSYTKGAEVRNEETSIYLMGGEVRKAFTADATQMLPYWGVDADGNIIQAQIISGEYWVRLDVGRLNTTLFTPFSSRYKWISERELRAALGDMDSWQAVTHTVAGDFATHLKSIGQINKVRKDLLEDVLKGKKPAHALHKPVITAEKIDEDSAKDLDKIYEFVKTYADEFYGKQFLVNAPFVCYAYDANSQKYRYSHEPSTDGCWVDDVTSTIIGLTHNSVASDFFRDQQGKYQAIVKFPLINGKNLAGTLTNYVADPSRLGDDNYITDAVDELWVKAELDSRWMFGTPIAPTSSTISFVIKIGAPITNRKSDVSGFSEQYGGVDLITGMTTAIPTIGGIDRGSIVNSALPPVIAPTAALCPTLSHVEVYGPWGVAGLPGQVILEKDDGFVPWEYGSDTIMYRAAYDKVADAVTQMRKGERGSITVAGFPNIPLGAELFSVDTSNPPTSQKGQKYLGTRTYSTDTCAANLPYLYVAMNKWTGEFGPNITQIDVQVGSNGFTTTYQFSTYTPQYGRFSKSNAERLKRIGQTRLQNIRNLRAKAFMYSAMNAAIIAGRRQFINSQLGKTSRAPKSAHHCLIGRYTSESRPEIMTQAVKDMSLSFQESGVYESGAIISLDGLFRPVSKNGTGGLPMFISPLQNDCSHHIPIPASPPINTGASHLDWSQSYLDPFANPTDTLPTERDGGSTPSGHDIEILGRGSTPPASGWAIKEGEDAGTGGYTSDYRFLALRGPIIIQQWGRDINGKPVPNKVDDESDIEAGIFATGDLEDKFLDGWLQKPKTWPVAPLDLVLDRERGVWTTPQPPRNIMVNITGCFSDTDVVELLNADTIFDSGGSALPSSGNVTWNYDINIPSGIGKVPTYYDPKECKSYIFPINRFDAKVGTGLLHKDVKQIVFSDGFTEQNWQSGTCKNILTISVGGGGGDVTGYIAAENWCVDNTDIIYKHGFRNIVFSTGLCVDQYDSETSRVMTCFWISGYDHKNNDTYIENTFTSLGITGNLSLIESRAGCDYLISGYPQVNVSGILTCNEGNMSTVRADTLAFGTGLTLSQHRDGIYRVDGRYQIGQTATLHNGGTVAPKQYERLYVATGLSIDTSEDCDITINSEIRLEHVVTCNNSTAPSVTDVPRFEKLVFGNGLNVNKNDDTEYEILTDIKIHDMSECSKPTPTINNVFQTLEVGSGIAVTVGSQTCAYRIDTYLLASGEDKDGVDVGPTRYTDLKFIGNLALDIPDDCTVRISGIGPSIYGMSVCNRSNFSQRKFTELTVNSGLQLKELASPDKVQIDIVINASGIDKNDNEVGPKIFENLRFIGNLKSKIYDDCTFEVSGMPLKITDIKECTNDYAPTITSTPAEELRFGRGLTIDLHSNDTYNISTFILIEDLQKCDKPTTSINNPFQTLQIGSGLLVSEESSDCTYRIDSYILVSGWDENGSRFDNTPFTRLNFLGNLVLTQEDDCVVSISGSNASASGEAVCSTAAKAPQPFTVISFGTGLDVNISNGKARIDGRYQISHDGNLNNSAINPFRYEKTILGSGLALVHNGCNAYIDADLRVTDLQQCVGDPTATVESETFEELRFGKGLTVTDGSNGIYVIDTYIALKDVSACSKPTTSINNPFQTLSLGSGLTPTSVYSNCEYRIDTYIRASGEDKDGVDVGPKRFTNLHFVGNLATKIEDACTVQVSGIAGTIYQESVCGRSSVPGGGTLPFRDLTLSTGLALTDLGSYGAQITAVHKVVGHDYQGYTSVGPKVFETINFVGNLVLATSGDCTVRVSGVTPKIFRNAVCGRSESSNAERIDQLNVNSGLDILNTSSFGYDIFTTLAASGLDSNGSSVGPKRFETLKFVGNLATSVDDACTVSISGFGASISSIGAQENCILAGDLSERKFDGLIFSGLVVEQSGSSNYYYVKHRQYIGKDEEDGCAAQSSVDYGPFTYLNIGSGLRLIKDTSSTDGCKYTIMGGMLLGESSCGYDSYDPANDQWYTHMAFGGGLSLIGGDETTVDGSSGCLAIIENRVNAGAVGLDGQSIKYDADCNSGLAVEELCTSRECGASFNYSGPYPDRQNARYMERLIGGQGIGVTTCDGCSVILFNNHRDYGYDNSCSDWKAYQVGQFHWSADFALSEGTNGGGSVDDSDGTLDTSITLSTGGGSWTCEFVTDITVTKNAVGYVTDVTASYGSIGGSSSCSGKKWITSTSCR